MILPKYALNPTLNPKCLLSRFPGLPGDSQVFLELLDAGPHLRPLLLETVLLVVQPLPPTLQFTLSSNLKPKFWLEIWIEEPQHCRYGYNYGYNILPRGT